MTNKDKSDSNSGVPRDVPVDWEALEDAFENNAPEVHSYLQLTTGEVLRVVDGVADPEMHARIATDAAYLRVEPVSSREQYRWMERFIQMLDEGALHQELTRAIDGKGAFRRFKDVLMGFGTERERWFTFRSERLRVFMEAWLPAHALAPVARDEWVGALRESAPPSAEEPSAARIAAAGISTLGDDLRAQLDSLGSSLPPRDLEKVVAFAEFLRARRQSRLTKDPMTQVVAARGIASATPDTDDDEPTSSRKVSAQR